MSLRKLLPIVRAHSFSSSMPLPIPAPRATGFTASTNSPLFWREDGPADAPTLILLHGGPGASHDYLYPQLLELARSHRVITYDQRGGGQSRTDDQTPITWRTHVADLASVMHEFGAPSPTVVGYSWGALLAMLYHIEQQQQPAWPSLGRLAVLSPAPVTRVWRDEFENALAARQRGEGVQALRDELHASGLRETDIDAFRQRSFEISVAGYFADPRRAKSLTPFRVMSRAQQSVWASLGDFDLRDALKSATMDGSRAVQLPVLVVHGRQDPIPLASASAVAEALDAKLVLLDDCGHVPYVEQPQMMFAAMLPFLA